MTKKIKVRWERLGLFCLWALRSKLHVCICSLRMRFLWDDEELPYASLNMILWSEKSSPKNLIPRNIEMDKQGGNRVVVLGGGIAGSAVAKSLQCHARLTLIDPDVLLLLLCHLCSSMFLSLFAGANLEWEIYVTCISRWWLSDAKTTSRAFFGAWLIFSLSWLRISVFRKEYFEIPWAILRGMVEPCFVKRTLINHRDYFTNGKIVTSRATDITETDVLTADGQRVPYDYLVIANGHANPIPLQ